MEIRATVMRARRGFSTQRELRPQIRGEVLIRQSGACERKRRVAISEFCIGPFALYSLEVALPGRALPDRALRFTEAGCEV